MSNKQLFVQRFFGTGGQTMSNELKPIVINPTEEEQKIIDKAVSHFWQGMFKMKQHRLTEWIEKYCKGADNEQAD